MISLEAFISSIFGYLPSSVIFMFTQVYSLVLVKIILTRCIFSQIYLTSVTLYLGVLNVSSFLQVCLITNQGWIGEMLDEDIIKASKIGILAHGLLNVYENILVHSIFFVFVYFFSINLR